MPAELPLLLAAAVLGAAAGPTLHGWAVAAGGRLPRGSRCRVCGGPRGWPGATCATCGTRGRRETLFPAVSALVAAGTAAVVGPVPTLPAYLVFAAVTLVLAVTDLDHKLIPNRVLYPGGGAAAALLAAGAAASGSLSALPRAVAGAAGYFAAFLVVALVARGGFGLGDVKLAALLGLFAAYESVPTLLVAVFFTGLLGGVPALVLLATRRARAGDELPYGPAMIVGAWAAIAGGDAFLAWYR